MSHELLFEIGTEEIPAGFLIPALENLKNLFSARLDALGLSFREIQGAATPRRLAVSVTGLADRQPDRQEQILGPPKKAAVDANNRFTKAAEGFARSKGATVEDLQVITTPKGEYVMLVQHQRGEETEKLLARLLPELITEIPFPKAMRWGANHMYFARPIQWLLTVYGGKVIPWQLENLASGGTTRGHRFMAPEPTEVNHFADYLETLRHRHVLADPAERREAVLAEINRAAGQVGGAVLPDEELVTTVTHLVEEPHAICGTFAERFLALPREVLITSMREHQKYFAVINAQGDLLPHFVAVNNTRVKEERLGVEGHERVLRARLEDAFFFFKEDQARPLPTRVEDLQGVIFQARLGTLLEKTERITQLGALLAAALAPEHEEAVKRAAHLAKADLLTAMVNEFPSLQGIIGRDYARLNGEIEEVATAISEHYLPVRAGGELPSSVAGALVGLADRLDTIAGCFGIGEIPTGTTDPFGLRRQSLALLHIIEDRQFNLSLASFIEKALELYGAKLTEKPEQAKANILDYIKGRYVNDLSARGVLPEAVEAVTAVAFDDVVDCRRKIDALAALSDQPTFTLLAGAFKRVINITKDHQAGPIREEHLEEPAERDLYRTYQAVTQEARPLLARRDYRRALTAILKMKQPVDRFFDEVMVMAEDKALRDNRLNLLSAIAQLFFRIGDFSKMYALGSQRPGS